MATPDINPRNDAEGNLGSLIRRWLKGFFVDIHVSGVLTDGTDSVNINTLANPTVYGTNLNRFISASETNTSAPHTDWVNIFNTSTTSLEAGDYELLLYYGWNHNATNSDFESRLFLDGVLLGDVFGNGTTHKEEPKDPAGSGGGSGSSQQLPAAFVFPIALASGVKTLVFDFRSDNTSHLSTLWGVYIKLIRVS